MRAISGHATRRLILGIVTAAVFASFPQLARAQAPGALTQLTGANSCIETTRSTGECPTSGTGMTSAIGVAVSPDGKNIYVLGSQDDSIAEFARSADGSLTQLASPNDCIANAPPVGTTSNSSCANAIATGLKGPQAIAIGPDGSNVYVAAQTITESARSPSSRATPTVR